MNKQKLLRIIVFEDVLSAVAVMDIKVEDKNSFDR